MTASSRSADETAIRALIDKRAEALRAKDADGVVSGQAPKADGKEHAGATKVEEGETKPPSSGTNEAASATNDETKIKAATGN